MLFVPIASCCSPLFSPPRCLLNSGNYWSSLPGIFLSLETVNNNKKKKKLRKKFLVDSCLDKDKYSSKAPWPVIAASNRLQPPTNVPNFPERKSERERHHSVQCFSYLKHFDWLFQIIIHLQNYSLTLLLYNWLFIIHCLYCIQYAVLSDIFLCLNAYISKYCNLLIFLLTEIYLQMV